MITEPGQSVFDLAARIPGLSGVQLQMIWKGADISEGTRAAELRQEARAKGLLIPSVAGIWKPGENILKTDVAEQVHRKCDTRGFNSRSRGHFDRHV